MNNYCTKCHKYYDANYIFNSSGIPRCTCGGTIKPDVVLYNEPLPEDVWEEAITAANKSDLMIVLGTSLEMLSSGIFSRLFSWKFSFNKS